MLLPVYCGHTLQSAHCKATEPFSKFNPTIVVAAFPRPNGALPISLVVAQLLFSCLCGVCCFVLTLLLLLLLLNLLWIML